MKILSNFNFYKANKAYGELYLQFPKVFLYSDKYKDLSDSAKIAYMVFKDRLQYSIRNNWVDKDGNVYFIYTTNEIMNLLNCSINSVTKIKKELIEKGLLLQVVQGFDPKAKKNKPNRLYLADLEVESYEVYAYQNIQKSHETLDNGGFTKFVSREENFETAETLGTNGFTNFVNREEIAETLDTSGFTKNELYLYKELKNKDNKEHKDQASTYQSQSDLLRSGISNTKSDPELEADLISLYLIENSLEDLYGKDLTHSLKKFSMNNFERFKLFHEKIHYANKGAERELGYPISVYTDSSPKYQIYQEQLNQTFWKCIQAEKYGKVEDINSYLFSSFKNAFLSIGKDMNRETKDLPSMPIHDWANED